MVSLVPLVFAAFASPQGAGAQEPSFDAQLAAIVPTAEEREWQSVPWRAEFKDALLEAADARKPVLLWAMNGHPLGQT